ncbi:hypothetical protein [Burkholderia territorii]|uniref:hypothetical protein n=1 Tax=Burkholderia territorii TaxID=1503055 RepID=UPI000A5DDFDA|nr:hypothetical protein [Burkholderia territorii]
MRGQSVSARRSRAFREDITARPIVECTPFRAAFVLSVHAEAVSCAPKVVMEVDEYASG